jgi:EAL domain-containing protein (putative c-di-GMP-specific phosphodiesterase class I)
MNATIIPPSRLTGRPKLLLVDDDSLVSRALARSLAATFDVRIANSVEEALEAALLEHFDLVVSDLHMPRLSGIDLVRQLRSFDAALPAVLISGATTLDFASLDLQVEALLQKPVALARLHQVANDAVRARSSPPSDRARDNDELAEMFSRALGKTRCAYQPIVDDVGRRVVAYEALLRCADPTLPTPALLFAAAERLGRVQELGRNVRRHVTADAAQLDPEIELFVNVHPCELADEDLYSPTAPLSTIAHRVVLELTERSSLTNVAQIGACIERLRNLGFRIAIDDLGAGYAGLSSVVAIQPDVVKVDMSIVRDVDTSVTKRRIVKSMIDLFQQLGSRIVLEGVETAGERDALAAQGEALMQGYFFARPAEPFVVPRWLDSRP